MGLIATAGDGKIFETAPAGTHIARCIRLIDIGTHPNVKFGKSKYEVLMFWELPTELDEEGKPFIVSRRYTLSVHEKSNLGSDLANWRGRPFTKEEADGFEVKNVVGKPCNITVVHNTKQDGNGQTTYANVNAVAGVIKGMKIPDQVNETVIYDMDNHDQTVYEALPEYIRKMIAESEERTGSPQEVAAAAAFEDEVLAEADDLPF